MIALHSAVTVSPKTDDEEKIRQLHLSATQSIKAGKLNQAIDELSEAQSLMSKIDIIYNIKPYLRLPLTLQQAGRFEEAVTELNRLLTVAIKPYNKSNVYDKLRLTHQREGRHSEAIEFGILCLAWECIALKEQKRGWSFVIDEPERWTKHISKSLKSIGRESMETIIIEKGTSFARQPSAIAANRLILEVRDVLQA